MDSESAFSITDCLIPDSKSSKLKQIGDCKASDFRRRLKYNVCGSGEWANILYFLKILGGVLFEIHVKNMNPLSLPNLKWYLKYLSFLFLSVRGGLRQPVFVL